jgi:hypothetical protein
LIEKGNEMKALGAVKRLKETAKDGAGGNLQQEWDRVAEIIKPQV